eukprot:COSAG05_NODE_8476_length_700_cov_0.718802_1_plen_108_part_01
MRFQPMWRNSGIAARGSSSVSLSPPAAWYTTLRRFSVRVDAKARFIVVLMCLAGVGSAWFHAQLSFAGQIFDELSVMWLILYASLLVVGDGPGLLGRIHCMAFNGYFL